jgi:hypothetical protein
MPASYEVAETDMDNLIDAATWMKSAEPGTMAYAMQQTAVTGPWTIGFLVREQLWRVQGLGRNPEVELRCGVFEQDGVLLIVMLAKISGELYETWFNYHQAGNRGEQYFRAVIEQPALTFTFFTPEPTRMIQINNRFGEFFAQALERIARLKPWSMREFDEARAQVYARYPTVAKLWKEIK